MKENCFSDSFPESRAEKLLCDSFPESSAVVFVPVGMQMRLYPLVLFPGS